jgi:DUF1009 family protein
MGETIGIIAGEGRFPFLVAEQASARGLSVAAAAFSGFSDGSLAEQVDSFREMKLGQLAKLFDFFKKNGVDKVVFAGGISKPRALDIRPDFRAMRMLLKAGTKGDDALLRSVASELEAEGMPVVSPLDIVPELGTPEGLLGRRRPKSHEWQDLRYGWECAAELGRWDIGQALMVRSRMIVAVEAMEGTDAMIRRGGELAGRGGVVVKVCKPSQDRRLDLPAVGIDTIRTMAEAGATCLGVAAGESLFFDREEAVAQADRAGISVMGLNAEVLGT